MQMRVLRFAALVVPVLFLAIAAAAEQTADEVEQLRQRGERLFNERKYTEAVATQRNVAVSTKATRDGAPGEQTANALTNLSWYALFARAPAEALKASERAHKLNPERLALETNRAHALLFLGRAREAQTLYLLRKGKRLAPGSDKTWEDTIAEDFGAMRAAGIIHKAFPSIVAQLGIAHPDPPPCTR
jgi:predicted Zn-dependent protease